MTDVPYQDALEKHRSGNLDGAEQDYLELLQADPQNADVLHLLSILHAQRGEFERALKFMQRALNERPESASFQNSMGNILKNLHEYSLAIKHFQEALRLEPEYAVAHNNLANVFYHLNQLAEASKHYLEAVRINPRYADAHYNLGMMLQHRNDDAGAIQHYIATIQLQPKHAAAHYRLAYLLQLQNDLDGATKHYQQSLRVDSNDAECNHNLGVVLTSKGKYAAAIRHFKKTLLLQPDHLEALNNLGAIYLLQKNPTLALKYFYVLAQKTRDYDAYFNLGTIYMDLGRYQDAIIYLHEALKVRADDFAAHSNLGAIFLRREDYKNAQFHYQKALESKPYNKEIIYILAAITQKDKPVAAPREYVESLFDQYASYYEQHLGLLGYKVPEQLFAAVSSHLAASQDKLNILDLGCGTGSVGVKFKKIANKIIGIDLSMKMLTLATEKNVYSELRQLSMLAALDRYRDLNLIIAADTFVYVGDLSEIFAKVRTALAPQGLFAFTVESGEVYPYNLQHSARFAHNSKYLEELIIKNGFCILHFDKIILRKQRDTEIEGYLYLLQA